MNDTKDQGKALTDLQKRFCEEYLVDLNGTKAAERAGYKKQSAASQASRLLTDDKISQYITELKAKRAEVTGSDAERVVTELKSLAFSNIKQLTSWDDKGHLVVKSSDDITDEMAACIESIKMDRHVLAVKVIRDGEDDEVQREEEYKSVITIKLHKKTPAIFLLMRHLGMLDDKDIGENPVLQRALDDLKRSR